MRVAQVNRESVSVKSFLFESTDGSSLPPALPGQFLVIKLRPSPDAAPLLRNYSMSGRPGAEQYRVSVKQEVNGAASSFLHITWALETRLKSVRREASSPCSQENGLWSCSASGSEPPQW